MNELVSYLRDLKARLGIKSDRELASKIGMTQAGICNIMTGGGLPNDEHCVKIALLGGDDPAHIIALAHKSKASESMRPYWDRILKVLAVTSIIFMIVIKSGAGRYIM